MLSVDCLNFFNQLFAFFQLNCCLQSHNSYLCKNYHCQPREKEPLGEAVCRFAPNELFMKRLYFIVMLLASFGFATAQNSGDFDQTFGNDGIQEVLPSASFNQARNY